MNPVSELGQRRPNIIRYESGSRWEGSRVDGEEGRIPRAVAEGRRCLVSTSSPLRLDRPPYSTEMVAISSGEG